MASKTVRGVSVALSCALFLCLTWVSLVDAAQRQLTLSFITKQADHIFVGTVKSTKAYRADWHGVGNIVFTDVTIEVSEEWKGSWETKTVTLQVPGGVLPDGSGMGVSGAPRFTENEKVLVFSKAYNGREWVYGWQQGKYGMKVRRVLGKHGYPVARDILSPALSRKVKKILREEG